MATFNTLKRKGGAQDTLEADLMAHTVKKAKVVADEDTDTLFACGADEEVSTAAFSASDATAAAQVQHGDAIEIEEKTCVMTLGDVADAILREKRTKKCAKNVVCASAFKKEVQNENLKNKHWSDKETNLFYEFLAQFGTSFDIIALKINEALAGCGKKTRKQVMLKFNREDKLNCARIDAALKCKKNV